MLTLRDIMTTDVVSVTPETTLRDAAELLAARHLGGAPVIGGGRVVGVVSTTDILTFAATTPGTPAARPDQTEWGDWFEEPPARTDEEEGAPDEGEPLGAFFTELWEDSGATVTQRIATVEGPEWSALDEHTVDEVMTRVLWALRPDDSVGSAADLMARQHVHRVLVMHGDRLLGLVTTSDVARVVADHQLIERRYVFNRARDFDDRGRDRDDRGFE